MEHLKIKLDDEEIYRINISIYETVVKSAKLIAKEILQEQANKTIYFTTEEASHKLGCSAPTLRYWRRMNRIKAHRIGAAYMYSSQAIKEAIESGLKHRRP